MKDPIIELKGLSKQYGRFKAVNNLDLTIYPGEIFGLLGPNGAGKTTTILMMLGLTDPTAGSARVCGYDATRQPLAVKKKAGYMPDSVGFYDNMTAWENLVYIGRLNGLLEDQIQNRASAVMEQVGLEKHLHQKTGTYSRGMKQRLGLAEVLIREPEVIILDEPTLGIDPTGVKEFLALIRKLSRQQGLTVLLSSHHLHHVQQVCDRIGIFVNGGLQAEGSINALSGQLFGKDGYVTSVNISQPWAHEAELKQWEAIRHIAAHGQKLEFSCSADITPQLVRFLVEKGYDITAVSKKEYGLDDIYQKYFENNSTEISTHEKSGSIFSKSYFKKHKNRSR